MAFEDQFPDIRDDFKKAHHGQNEQPPSKPKMTLELTPGGTLEQTVHTKLEEAKRAEKTPPQIKDVKTDFKIRRRLKQIFNRAAGRDPDRGR